MSQPTYTEEQLRAYRALEHASQQIGSTQYRNGRYRGTYRRGKLVRGYTITPEHRMLVDAMPAVLKGTLSVEAAMAMVTQPDVMKQRFEETPAA